MLLIVLSFLILFRIILFRFVFREHVDILHSWFFQDFPFFLLSIWLCLAYKRWAMAQRTDQRINQAFRPIISRAILFSCHHVIIHTLWMCLLALWRTLLLPPSAFVFYLLSFFHSVRREPDSRALVRSSI